MDESAAQWRKLLGVASDARPLECVRAFEQLAPKLAPHEMKGVQFYCMPISALPAEFVTSCNLCEGWYHPWCYYWVRKYLPEDRGPGAAVIVRDFRSREYEIDLARQAQAVYESQGGPQVSVEE